MNFVALLCLSLILCLTVGVISISFIFPFSMVFGKPLLRDAGLNVEKVASGLSFPTNMAFIGKDDILVLEKDKGTVNRVVDGKLLSQPLLHFNVSNGGLMLGIATTKQGGHNFVFISLAEAEGNKSQPSINGGATLLNRVYRYEFKNNELINPELISNIPLVRGPDFIFHTGGIMVVGPDKNLYYVVGDGGPAYTHKTLAVNVRDGSPPDGTGGILRFTLDGKPVAKNIFGKKFPLNLYYAYGIRNAFGMDFDPITGKLWDTENGPSFGDEVNLIEPGFNGGWQVVQGMGSSAPDYNRSSGIDLNNYIPPSVSQNLTFFDPLLSMDQLNINSDAMSIGLVNHGSSKIPKLLTGQLVSINGKGKYSDPKFAWQLTVGVTALKFYDSDKLGSRYKGDMFVGDINNGRIYDFKLNQNRTEISINGTGTDKVKLENLIFAEGFGGITDLKVSPDGYLYVLSYSDGVIYRITKK